MRGPAEGGRRRGPPSAALCLLGLLSAASAAAGKAIRYHIFEEEPPGTVIGTLADDLPPLEPPAAGRAFRLLKPPGNGSLVRVRERDGQLSLGPERLDREALCGASAAWCALSFDVVCLEGGGGGAGGGSPSSPASSSSSASSPPSYRLLQVELEVRDINDHAPRFPQALLALEVSEAALPGTRLPLGLALDPDAGANGVQSFALSPNRHFGLEAPRRADGLKGAELVLLAPLDREAQAAFRLELVAKDGGSPARSGTATLALRVLDANDNAPAFPRGGAPRTLELPEDAPPGAALLELGAADPDEGANGALLYAWGSQVPAEARALFALDPLSGRLSLRAALDYERQRAFELDVQASDRGASPLRAACKVLVRLRDVNDNAPQLAVSPLRGGGEEGDGEEGGPEEEGAVVAYVSEAAPPGSLVALISVWDRDSGANGQVRLSLLPSEEGHEGPAPPFVLRPAHDDEEEEEGEQGPAEEEGEEAAAGGSEERARSFLLLTSGPLDRERVPEYNLTLLAQDLGSPPARSLRRLRLRLADENDHAPRFASPALRLPLPENNPPGAFLAALAARDPDLGPNGRVAYRLLEDGEQGQQQQQRLLLRGAPLGTYVSLDAASGALYALRSFDYEALKELRLTVVATDGGSPPLSSAAQVTIRVLDLNDNAPVITHPAPRNGSLELAVSRRAARGAAVGQVRARDADEGANAELSFALLRDPEEGDGGDAALGLFAVDAGTGAVVLTGSLAGEPPGKAFRALLRVSDGGRPSLSATAALRFVVTAAEPDSAAPPSSPEGPKAEVAGAASAPVQWDGPLIVIAVLAGSCTLLLVAIIAIATSCNRRKRQKQLQERLKEQQEEKRQQGVVLEEPRDASPRGKRHQGGGGGSPGGGGGSVGFSAEPSPASDGPPPSDSSSCSRSSESASLYGSSQGRLRPANEPYALTAPTPGYGKEVPPPPPVVPLWKGHSFNTISGGREGDKFSGKDSGKGDSDFNDSDSDVSGDALKRDLITHMQNGLWACTAECKILGHSDRCWSPSCGRTNPHCSSHPKTQLSTFCKSTSLPRDSIRRDNYYQAQLPKTVGLQSVYEKVLHRDYDRTMTLLSPPHPGRLPDLQEISVPLYQAPSTRYLGPPPETNQNG